MHEPGTDTTIRFDPTKLSADAARALSSILRSGKYEAVAKLPQPGGRRWFTEPLRLGKFITGGVNCWKQSPWPGVYNRLLRWQNGEAPLMLFDLFFLQRQLARTQLETLIDDKKLKLLDEATVLVCSSASVRSTIRCYPIDGMYLLFDPTRDHYDFVYLGWDSHLMVYVVAKYSGRRRFQRSLDLCTGSGIQGLSVARRSEETVCTDINPRAVAMVQANARLNELHGVQAVHSDLFADVSGNFDCITANTPYVPRPPGGELPIGGGDIGIEFTLRLLREIPDRLTNDGIAIVYTSDPIVHGKRRLLTHVQNMLGHLPLHIVQIPLFTTNYPMTKPLQEHYDRVGLSGYDDCILVIEPSKRYAMEQHQWDGLHYYRTRLDAWLDWRRRRNAHAVVRPTAS